MTTTTITIYGDRTEHSVTLPAKWVVCPSCEGRGVTTRHIECEGGGFTAEEWRQACDDDEEFSEKYLGGFYDRPCNNCKGRTTILAINRRGLTRWQKKLVAAYDRQCMDLAEIDAISAAERRMGA